MTLPFFGRVVAVGVSICASLCMAAETYPAKPIRIVVPFAAGGTSDVVTRIVAPRLAELWAQQLIVDNRPGAGGNIGTEMVVRAPADGYTLMMATVATHGIGPSVYRKTLYDPLRDFAPITLLASTPSVVMAHPALPVNSIRELVALAGKRPGELYFGSAGNGGSLHLAGELFNFMNGIRITHVPYKGTAAAMVDLMAGNIQLMFDTLPSALPQIKGGKLKALAVTSARRAPALPELPTVAEAGVRGYEVTSWYGPLAPAATPVAIVRRLNQDFVNAIASPDIAGRLTASGTDPVGGSAEDFRTFIQSELIKWARVVKESGTKID